MQQRRLGLDCKSFHLLLSARFALTALALKKYIYTIKIYIYICNLPLGGTRGQANTSPLINSNQIKGIYSSANATVLVEAHEPGVWSLGSSSRTGWTCGSGRPWGGHGLLGTATARTSYTKPLLHVHEPKFGD